jgi:hypothetical protein
MSAHADLTREDYELRRIAARDLARAIRAGLIHPTSTCQRCGQKATGNGHGIHGIKALHLDVAQPLAVEWLCHLCYLEGRQQVRDYHKRLKADAVRKAATR